jgi:hypothetical protein
MPHGRQLRLFLADGTSSGPRYYEIVNRTIQGIVMPATRIPELTSKDWTEFQRPGVYLVQGATEEGARRLYIGTGENVARRVQKHPEKLEFEVESLLAITSKDENLNASQVGWLESSLISAARAAKRIFVQNVQQPELPLLSKPELATVSEFIEDLILIAQTAGFDFFTSTKKVEIVAEQAAAPAEPEISSPEFVLTQPIKGITARGSVSDKGFVVKAGSDAIAQVNESFKGSYFDLRSALIETGVLIPKSDDPEKLTFAVDYAFEASSAAASVIVGNQFSGPLNWKANGNQTLGQYQANLSTESTEPHP